MLSIKQMSSNKCDVKYPRDTIGPFYTDKNNKKYYFRKDDKGNKAYYPRDEKGYYCPDENGNQIYITYVMTELDKTYTSISSNKETDISLKGTNTSKLVTHLVKELYSSGYITENINPNDIKNTMKKAINKFLNPELSRCKAIISTGNRSYKCSAPVKFGSEYCGRKHKT
jgi:hypothetical protein